jgi:hypothetical protein
MAWVCASGSFKIKTKDEGKNANGVKDGAGNLISGYSSNFKQVGSKFVFQIFHSSYKGLDPINGTAYDGVAASEAKPQLVIESPAYTSLSDLIKWFQTSTDFNEGFELTDNNLAAVVDETKATATITVNSVPALNQYVGVYIDDPVYGYQWMGEILIDGTLTTTAAIATAIAGLINGSNKGYTAVAAASVVTVTARNGLGATINNYELFLYGNNIWANISWTNFAGGVDSSEASGLIEAADAALTVLATGGTEIYGTADFDTVLSKINGLDFVHILALRNGADAMGANNDKLKNFVEKDSKYDRILVVAGGFDKSERDLSKTIAAYFNSDRVIVVHGGVKKTVRVNGFKVFSSLYHAAAILGRCVGLPPQVPVTLKSIGIDGVVDALEDVDQQDLIDSGVMHSYNDTELGGLFVVGLDVNSLQKNEFLINDDGTTYNWALKRIEADLNKSVIINGKKRFFDPNGQGGNRNTTSEEEVSIWAEKHLNSRTASDQKDDLIISFQNVAAVINQDNISLTYDFVPNSEIKAILSTGTMIEG